MTPVFAMFVAFWVLYTSAIIEFDAETGVWELDAGEPT